MIKTFILTIQVCSSVLSNCLPPAEIIEPFKTHNECALRGYELALKTHQNLIQQRGELESNKYKVAVKFWCKEGKEEIKTDA